MAKIVLLTLEYEPFRGGVACYLGGLVGELRRNEHEVIVVGSDGGCDVQMGLLSRLWPKWLWPVWHIFQLVKRECPDYVMISHVLPMGYVAAFLCKVLRVPFVVVVHGLDVAAPRGLKRRFVKKFLECASLIIANSDITKSYCDCDAIVVYPGIELDDCDTSELSGHEILSVGRLVERKGFDVLIRAMDIVHERFSDAQLTIVGAGPDRERLEQMSGSRSGYVRLVGGVDAQALHHVYRTSDVFALVARDIDGDFEGFGIVYLEAALHGLPCVAGRAGGAVEAVEDRRTGLIVDSTDEKSVAAATIALLEDKELARALGRNAKERAENKFVWTATARPLVEYLQLHRPLVSVIIPAFNRQEELNKCLDSLRNQQYQNLEIIVVDDGSNKPIFVSDGIKLIRQTNAGAPAARNRGFEASGGRFVLFCDQDVVLRPDVISRMVEGLVANPAASYAYCEYRFGPKRFRVPEFDEDLLKHRNYIHTTSLIRRDDFPGFDESLRKFQDWDVWLTMLARGKKGVKVDSFFAVSQHGEGMSRWLPKFMYRFGGLKRVQQYREAEKIIRDKHEI